MRLLPDFYRRKQAELRGRLQSAGLAGLLVFKPANLYYLLGFFFVPTERVIVAWVPAEGEPTLFVPKLEEDHAAAHSWLDQVEVYFEHLGPPPPLEWIAARLKQFGHARGRLGCEASLPDSVLSQLRRALPGARWASEGGRLLADMRLVKEPAELDLVRRAGEYSDFMVAAGAEAVRERGLISELEINQAASQAVAARLVAEAGEGVFVNGYSSGLVCAGPRAAFPHGPPTLARPRPGDCLILSFGCTAGGYHAESERTYFIGEPSPEQARLYEAVRQAQAAGLAQLDPGRACAEANRAALECLREAGFGGYIRHRLGHGLGLEGHEPPWLEAGDSTVLRAGMVVSAEPGLYVPGQGGCRLSDTVIVGRAGPKRVTAAPRDLASAVLAPRPWG